MSMSLACMPARRCSGCRIMIVDDRSAARLPLVPADSSSAASPNALPMHNV